MCKLLVPMGTTSIKTMYKYYDLDLLHIYDVFIDKKLSAGADGIIIVWYTPYIFTGIMSTWLEVLIWSMYLHVWYISYIIQHMSFTNR